jgi:hypothetical protein
LLSFFLLKTHSVGWSPPDHTLSLFLMGERESERGGWVLFPLGYDFYNQFFVYKHNHAFLEEPIWTTGKRIEWDW